MSSNTSTGPANNMRSYSGADLTKTTHHDQPIKTMNEDLFGWGSIAEGIKQRLTGEYLGDMPIVVGLYGSWGSGKSSLMNLVESKLQPSLAESATSLQAVQGQRLVGCDCEGGRLIDVAIERLKLWVHDRIRICSRLYRLAREMARCLWARGSHWLSGSSGSEGASLSAIHSHQVPIIVRFNPWYFKGDAALISAFLDEIASKLEGSGVMDRQTIAELLRLYAKSLITAASIAAIASDITGVSLTASHASKAFSGAALKIAPALNHAADSFDKGSPSLQAQREKLVDTLRLAQTRIVVLIDDIDRLYPDDVLTMMKLVKLVGDLPYMSYLLAFDDKVVAGCLERAALLGSTGQTGFGYLEKIVQVSERVPAHSDQQLLKTALAGLHATLYDRRPEYRDRYQALLEDLWVPVFGYRLANLRQVGRLLNTVQSAVGSAPESSDMFMIVLVESLGVLYPSLRTLLEMCSGLIVLHLQEPLRATLGGDGNSGLFEKIKATYNFDMNQSDYEVWCKFTETVRMYFVQEETKNRSDAVLREAMNRGRPVYRPASRPLHEKFRSLSNQPTEWVQEYFSRYNDDVVSALRDICQLSPDVVVKHGGGVGTVLIGLLSVVQREAGAESGMSCYAEHHAQIEDLLGRAVGGLAPQFFNYRSQREREMQSSSDGHQWKLMDDIRDRSKRSVRFIWALRGSFLTKRIGRRQAAEGGANEDGLRTSLAGIDSIIVSILKEDPCPDAWLREDASDAFCGVMNTYFAVDSERLLRRKMLRESIKAKGLGTARRFVTIYFGRGISKLSTAEAWLTEVDNIVDVKFLREECCMDESVLNNLDNESISNLKRLPDDERAMTLFAYAYKRSRLNTPHAPN